MKEISVLMAVYNNENTLGKAIESILNQTLSNFDFVIVDDCSTDSSLTILRSYQEKDSRIHIFRNEVNLGLAGSLNKGLEFCNTKYVARMDADDISYPERLETQYKFLRENQQVQILGSGVFLVDEGGNRLSSYLYPKSNDEIQKKLKTGCPIAHPTVMYEKSVIQSAGGYDATLRKSEDYDLWRRLSGNVVFHNLGEPLLDYTIAKKKSFKTILTDFKVALRYGKWNYRPWLILFRNVAVNLGLYTPRSLRKIKK